MSEAIDLAPFLLPPGEVRCAWRVRERDWQLTITTATARRRRVRIYHVDPIARIATLVGEIGHAIDRDRLVEDRRLRAGGGAPKSAPPIAIPRRMRVGESVATVGGAATVTLVSCARRRGRRAIVLAAREPAGTGTLELLEGVGEVRIGDEKRVVYFEIDGEGTGRAPSWWRGVRLVGARLVPGADSIVL